MHLSIPLIGLIGLTFAAANPVTVGGAPSPACLAKCNAAYTRCDETADAQTGIVSGGEAVTCDALGAYCDNNCDPGVSA